MSDLLQLRYLPEFNEFENLRELRVEIGGRRSDEFLEVFGSLVERVELAENSEEGILLRCYLSELSYRHITTYGDPAIAGVFFPLHGSVKYHFKSGVFKRWGEPMIIPWEGKSLHPKIRGFLFYRERPTKLSALELY